MGRSEEIEEEIEHLKRLGKQLIDKTNDIWVEKERLRVEYKKITGKDI